MFDSSLESGKYPDKPKVARVTLFHKGRSKTEMKNCSSISIFSVFNKIFETIIKRRLLNFWNKYNVFVLMQFGFRENHSTTLAFAHLNQLIINDLDHNNSVCATFSDTCYHKILQFKLEQKGIRKVANDIIRSYLTSGKLFVSGTAIHHRS